MGVYIRDMEMPEKGEYHMTLYVCSDGSAYIDVASFPVDEDRFELVPVPPHRDLIDRADLWTEINKICDRRDAGIITDLTCLQQILSAVRHAPTAIPASEEKED